MNKGIFVSGIGTEVGKTVVSAFLAQALEADYWKPVQSGDLDYSDSHKIRAWAPAVRKIHPETFRLENPLSPHASARIDGVEIRLKQFQLPQTDNFLVVEGAGGLWVPLSEKKSMLDLIQHLGFPVVLVSRHYLGSINHTMLSLEALHQRKIPIAGLIWNGPSTPDTERIIEQFSGVRALLRLEEFPEVNAQAIARAADQHSEKLINWKNELTSTR
jgi:dethiobiotin synthetase